jgi:hypothetical protein
VHLGDFFFETSDLLFGLFVGAEVVLPEFDELVVLPDELFGTVFELGYLLVDFVLLSLKSTRLQGLAHS